MTKIKGHIGSSFEDFLEEQDTLKETTELALKRVRSWQAQTIDEQGDGQKSDGQ